MFVAETSEAATELTELGVPGDRVTVVGAGVDLDRFRPMRTARSTAEMRDLNVAVYAGRFDLRQKRLDLLLGAWEAAGLRGWELLLAGAGRDELVVRRLAERLPDVRVLEWQEDVPSLLSSASLFVLPTVAETSALSMLEGMACGLPGIVSSIDSLMARRPDGVSFAKNEPMAWIAALRDIDALGSAGREAAGSRARGWVELNADAAGAQARWSTLLSPVSG